MEIKSWIITRNSVKATLTPLVAGGCGVLNQTTSHFGINAAGSGDMTDQLNGVARTETISISFDRDVVFISLAPASFSGTEAALLTLGNFSTPTFSAGTANGVV